MKDHTEIPYSVLDLAPIRQGGTAVEAFHNTLDLARHAERWDYHRYWLAEHHNLQGVASAGTAVRFRLPFRARLPARGPRPVPDPLPAVRGADRTLRHGRGERDRGRHRRGGPAAVHVAASAVPQPGARHTGAAPAAG